MLVRVALMGAALLLMALGGGAWLLVQPPAAPFVAPGASELRVTDTAPGVRQIAYRMTRPEDGWQTLVVRAMRHAGWEIKGDRYAWGDTERYVPTYTRSTRLWFIRMDEEAKLLGSRERALVTVERRIRLVWR